MGPSWGAQLPADRPLTVGGIECAGRARRRRARPNRRPPPRPAPPGFTRAAVKPGAYALITPESRTWAPAGGAGWVNASWAHLASPAGGARFSMALVDLGASGAIGPPPSLAVERLMFVLDGEVEVAQEGGAAFALRADGFAFFAAGAAHAATSRAGAGVLLYERVVRAGDPRLETPVRGVASALPTTDPGGGETFALRKLLPPTAAFNVHVMDFEPGQHLTTKEAHHNEHGLLMVEGQGVYRLGDDWHPVTVGDAVWMAPFTLQWYGALGTTRTRYIIYKDTPSDPVLAA